MGIVEDFFINNKSNAGDPPKKSIVGSFYEENYTAGSEDASPQTMEGAGDVKTEMDLSKFEEIESGSNDIVNSIMSAWDQTQLSAHEDRLNNAQNVIDKNVDTYNNLKELVYKDPANRSKYEARLFEIEQINQDAEKEIESAKNDISVNEREIKSEQVSKLYRLNEALVASKGADASFGEMLKYSAPSGLGSMGSMAAQQLIATFGKKGIDKIATAALTGAIEGLAGGPAAEITSPTIAIASALTQIGLLWNARASETASEAGDAVKQANNKLTENWYKQYNPDNDPNGPQPSEEDLRQIRMKSMEGIDNLRNENMSLLAADGIEMLVSSSLFPGSSIIKGLGKIGGYNKYTRAAKIAGTLATGTQGERLEEGVQNLASRRQFDDALDLNIYSDKGFMQNTLVDGLDAFESINWAAPGFGNINLGGKYANDKEFQSAAEAGGLLGFISGGLVSGVKMTSDINKYLETSKELKDLGITNTDEKVLKIKDAVYYKHFDKGSVDFLLEGVRNLNGQVDPKTGDKILSDEDKVKEVKNISDAYDKYVKVNEYLDDLIPEGRFNNKKTPKQSLMINKAKQELFSNSMALSRNSKEIGIVANVQNISNLIDHQQKIVNNIENSKSDVKNEKTYNLNSRLKIAKSKLNELVSLKSQILSDSNIEEKDLPLSNVDESIKNKEYLINNLNLSEIQNNYNELLKIKDNKTLEDWYNKNEKSKKEVKEVLDEEVKPDPQPNENQPDNSADESFVSETNSEPFVSTDEEDEAESNRIHAENIMNVQELKKKASKQKELEETLNNSSSFSDINENTQVKYAGMTGTVYKQPEENAYTFVDSVTKREYDIPQDSELGYDGKLYEYGIFELPKPNPVTDLIDISDNGDITIDGKTYKNNYSNPLSAINKDKDGNVVSVTLSTVDGKNRTFKKYADEIAYSILLHIYNKLENEGKAKRETIKSRLTETTTKSDTKGKESVVDERDSEESRKIEEAIANLEKGIKESQNLMNKNSLEEEQEKLYQEAIKSKTSKELLTFLGKFKGHKYTSELNKLYKYLVEKEKPVVEKATAELNKGINIDDFIKKLKNGEALSSPEEIEFYEKNSDAIDEILRKEAEAVSSKDNKEGFPNTKSTVEGETFVPNKLREQLAETTELMTSKKVQEVIDRLISEGKNINDVAEIKIAEFKGEKSIEVWVDGKILFFIPAKKGNYSDELQGVINQINSNIPFNKSGLQINISNGYIKAFDNAITLDVLSPIVKTNGDYVIIDQGTDKKRAEGGGFELIRDGKGAVEAKGVALSNKQKNLGRYILSFIEPASGVRKFIAIKPAKLTDYTKYLDSLFKLSSTVVKAKSNNEALTVQELANKNNEINNKVFIAIPQAEVGDRNLEIDLNIDDNGDLRVNLIQVINQDGKAVDKVLLPKKIKKEELTDSVSVLAKINDILNKAEISIEPKSFRNAIPKGELVGKDISSLFETYTAPEVLEGQDVLLSVNKLSKDSNTVESDNTAKTTVESVKTEETPKEIDEFDVDTDADPIKPNAPTTFKLADSEVTELISQVELDEVNRIIPKETKVELESDFKEFVKNVNTSGTAWGYFRNNIISLWTGAQSGTGYHEAFHAIFRTAINNKDVNRYLKLAAIELKGKYTTKELNDKLEELRNSSIDYLELTNAQLNDLMLEEYLADKFADWKKNKSTKSLTGLRKFFERFNEIVNLLFTNKNTLEAFFNKIDRGAFSSTKAIPNKQSFVTTTAFKNLISGVETSMSSTKSKKIINTFAARVRQESRKAGVDESNEEILDRLINERLASLNTKGKEYITSITDPVLKKKLLKSWKEEVYSLKNDVAKELLVEQVNKKLKIFDNKSDLAEENEEGQDNEKGGETGFGAKESWTLSLEESTNKVIKEYIAFAMYKTIDELTGELVDLSVDAQIIYNGLGHILANTEEDKMMDKFIVYSKDNEQAKAVLDMIMSDTMMATDLNDKLIKSTRNANDLRKIITAFKNSKITFLHTGFENGEVTVGNANMNTAERLSVSEWVNNVLYIKRGKQADKQFWESKIEAGVSAFTKNKFKVITDKELDEQIKDVQKKFAEFGITLSSGYLRYSILSYNNQFNAGEFLTDSQKNDVEVFNDNNTKPLDILTIKGDSSGYSLYDYLPNDKDPFEEGKEVDKMGGKIKAIAKNNGLFDESLAASNFKGADGNTRYDLIKPSYVLDETQRLRSPEYREWLKNKYEILKDNLLFRNNTFLNNLQIDLISGVRDQSFSDNEGKVFGDFSEREYLMQHIGYWFAQRNNQAYTLFRQNEAANTAYVAKMPVDNLVNDKGLASDKAVDQVYSFFKAEYNRIGREKAKGLGNIKGYNNNDNGRAFRFTEFANLAYSIGGLKYNQLTQDARVGSEISKELEYDVKKAIESSLNSQIKEFKEILANNKLITINNGVITPSKIIPKTIGGKKLEGNDLNNTLGNMYLNDYINSFSLNQLFDGDYALSRDDKGVKEVKLNDKGEIDNENGVKVLLPKQDLSIDIVKRNKGAMGSGSDLGKGTHRVAFIKDINVFVDGKKDGQLIRSDKGDKINSNDAQSYTNINHAMFITERLGKMSDDVRAVLRKIRRGYSYAYKNAENEIIDIKPSQVNFKLMTYTDKDGKSFKVIEKEGITSKEQQKLEDSGASLNPFKTVTFGREWYIKTSEALISRHEVSYITNKEKYNLIMDELESRENTKELTKQDLIEFNKELVKLYKPIPGKEYYHEMLNQMDIHGIDQIVAESASKGATIEPVDTLANGFDLSKSMVDISNSYKRLQVETPTGKNSITDGTQLMQLIDSEQDDSVEVTVNGKLMTIGEVRKQYRTAMADTRDNSFKIAAQYIKYEGNKVAIKPLRVKFLKALESSGADEQLLEIFGLNWNLLPAVDKAEQLFLSHFGGGVLAQKVPGTKVAMMSDAHWNVVVRKKTGEIILNKSVKSDIVKYENKENYETRKLKHNVRDSKTGMLYSECVLSERVFSKFGLKIGDEIPVDLATMLGYRIPTQDKHSMTSLRVVDVLPNYLEGTGIFPAELVLLSGADFDIDSLFIQQPSFWMNNGVATKAGSEKTNKEKFDSFLNYIKEDKLFKIEVEDRLAHNDVMIAYKDVKKSERTKELKAGFAEAKDSIIKGVLISWGLPSNEIEYAKYIKDGNATPNNNALNNNALDYKLALLTNKGVEDLALEPVSSDALIEEARYVENDLKTDNKKVLSTSSSLIGKAKAFFQNSAGKAGIGPVANSLQAFTLLAKNKIRRSSETPLIIDGVELSKFDYTNQLGTRVADTLSTILSVMTDNAKDPIAGKIGLTLELLTTYNYLVSLGVPLRTITKIINTPSVQMYANLLKENKYSLKTEDEKSGTRFEKEAKLFKEILGKIPEKSDLKATGQIITTDLESMIKEGLNDSNRAENLAILVEFMEIEKEAQSFQDLNNIIKLTKGLPTSFNDTSKGFVDSLHKLKINTLFGIADLERFKDEKPAFDITEAVKNDPLLFNNIKNALQVLKYSEGIFITETKPFKNQFETLLANLKDNISKDTIKELRRSFLGHVSTRAYINYMRKTNADFNPANDGLLFPKLGEETLGKQLVKLKSSEDESIKNNSFIKWLKVDLGFPVDEYSGVIYDKVSGKSFIKLSVESINDIVNSFNDLWRNPETKDFAENSFHYLLTKDNLEFRNDSFVKYIAPLMFTNVSEGLNAELEALLNGDGLEEFNEISKQFRALNAGYIPTQGNLKKIELSDKHQEEYVFDYTKSQDLFDSKKVGSQTLFKYPEYIIIKIGKKSELYHNDLQGRTEGFNTNAIYKKQPSFGYKAVTVFGKTVNDNLDTYIKLNQIKEKEIQEKAKSENPLTEAESKAVVEQSGIDNNIPKQNKTKTDNNLDLSEKSGILFKNEKTDSGIPISELYSEDVWNSFEQIKKDYIKNCY